MLWARSILHVDMDAFFASVEQRDTPALQKRPVVVGALHRGVVTAASYEARVFGVRSAMPMREALRRCPEAIVVKPRFEAYQKASQALMAILKRFTPLIEPLSLDEAFLDVTGSQVLFGEAPDIARQIQHAIKNEICLSASAGVAPSKFVAKLASDENKPFGLKVVAQDEVVDYLAPLPIGRMWGAGRIVAPKLQALGVTTFATLRGFPTHLLEAHLGKIGPLMQKLAQGIDPREVIADVRAKSIGSEATFAEDIKDLELLKKTLLHHCLKVSERLMAHAQHALGLQIKLKRADFVVTTRQMALARPSFDTDSLFFAAKELLHRVALHPQGYRLIGVAVTQLGDGPPPKQLFVDAHQLKSERLEGARALIAAKFGKNNLTRASLLEPVVNANSDAF